MPRRRACDVFYIDLWSTPRSFLASAVATALHLLFPLHRAMYAFGVLSHVGLEWRLGLLY